MAAGQYKAGSTGIRAMVDYYMYQSCHLLTLTICCSSVALLYTNAHSYSYRHAAYPVVESLATLQHPWKRIGE